MHQRKIPTGSDVSFYRDQQNARIAALSLDKPDVADSFENVLVADGVNQNEQEKENRAPSYDTNWQRCELLPRSAKRRDYRPFPR